MTLCRWEYREAALRKPDLRVGVTGGCYATMGDHWHCSEHVGGHDLSFDFSPHVPSPEYWNDLLAERDACDARVKKERRRWYWSTLFHRLWAVLHGASIEDDDDGSFES